MKLNLIEIINLEWNCYNGFCFSFFYIETHKSEGALFGINAAKEFLYIDLFFRNIKVFENYKDKNGNKVKI